VSRKPHKQNVQRDVQSNFIVMSNPPDCIPIVKGDRRFWRLPTSTVLEPPDYYRNLNEKVIPREAPELTRLLMDRKVPDDFDDRMRQLINASQPKELESAGGASAAGMDPHAAFFTWLEAGLRVGHCTLPGPVPFFGSVKTKVEANKLLEALRAVPELRDLELTSVTKLTQLLNKAFALKTPIVSNHKFYRIRPLQELRKAFQGPNALGQDFKWPAKAAAAADDDDDDDDISNA
jgi:hypothetical protein